MAAGGSVKFTLAERQLKLFKNALHSLSKIGSDLLVEALTGRLVLRSINSSRSAYLSVTFESRFFDEYHVFDCTVVQAGLLLKHVLSTFRTQRVSRITFELKTVDSRATVTLYCDNGLRKSYKIPSMEAEILQATVDKEAFLTCALAETGAMSKLLSSFHSGLEEVTIIAWGGDVGRNGSQASKVQLHSFLDPLKGHVDKSLFTQLAVDTREVFLSYVHNSDADSDVTFNFKDFRVMLGLCDSLNSNVKLQFEGPGLPLVVESHFPTLHGQDVDCEAELILATLMESHSLPRMADDGVAAQKEQEQQQFHARGQHGVEAAAAGDSWLHPEHIERQHQQVIRNGALMSGVSGPETLTGRLGTSSKGAPDHVDSPQPVPSGLLDDPFHVHQPPPGSLPRGRAAQPSPGHIGRPSRLGMAAVSRAQSGAARSLTHGASIGSPCRPEPQPGTPGAEEAGALGAPPGDQRILRPRSLSEGAQLARSPSRSWLEASARRVAQSDREQEGNSAEDSQAPMTFIKLWLAAIRDGNARWTSSPELSDLFDDSATLTTPDRQTFHGKAAVLRRLDKGVEMLVKMAGKDAQLPTYELQGPVMSPTGTSQLTCTIKRGKSTMRFKLEFTMQRGRIVQLRNSRA